MRFLVLFLVLASTYAISLDYNTLYTAPSSLQDNGYVYVTFCSRNNEIKNFQFSSSDISVSPYKLTIDFSGTATIPDCKQAALRVSSNSPGLFTIKADTGGDVWSIPVEFSKNEPITISISNSVVYTGYDSVDMRINGVGDNVWITIDASILGTKTVHRLSLPTTVATTFYFSKSGFYEIPLSVRYDRNNKTITQNYTLGLRVEEAPFRVKGNLRVPSDGFSNLSLALELPEKVYSGTVKLNSSCLEGGTSKNIENFESGKVDLYVKGVCDPGLYSVKVSVGDYEVSVPLILYGPEGFELFTNTFVKNGKHTLEVTLANEGSQTMKAVSVRLLKGNYEVIKEGSFLGDLNFGDFDSAELVFIPKSKDTLLTYNITYTFGGKKIYNQNTFLYRYSPSTSKAGLLALLSIVLVGAYYVRRRKSRD